MISPDQKKKKNLYVGGKNLGDFFFSKKKVTNGIKKNKKGKKKIKQKITKKATKKRHTTPETSTNVYI